MGILFWAIFCACFLLTLLYLIKRELPRLLPLNGNFAFSILIFMAAASLFILTYLFLRSWINLALIICPLIAYLGFLPRVPRRLSSWRDVIFAFIIGITFFCFILADGIPRGPDTWSKPYFARSAAQSIASLTEPGWDIGWMLGFDYTVYGAFSPVMSGLFTLLSGDNLAGVRLEMFTAFIFLPPLAYLVGRRVGRNRWGGFVTLLILVTARIALGYIGISRFWAVALLPALWLALCGWREGKRGYAPLVTVLLAAAVFIHTQVGAMALLLFSGFSLEMLWRRRKGMFRSWVGILLGLVALTTVWWQNIGEQSPVIFVSPQFVPWDSGGFAHAWQLTTIALRHFIDPFNAIRWLPDIYSTSWYLGALTVVLGSLGLILWMRCPRKRNGVFPALWAGGLVLLVNLPLLYAIPVLGNLLQPIVRPMYFGETYDELIIGFQRRYMLLCWLVLGILAAKTVTFIHQHKQQPFMTFCKQLLLALLTLSVMESQTFWVSLLKANNETNPRKSNLVLDVMQFFNRQPVTEKVLYDLPIDYGGIQLSSLTTAPVLQGWIANGFNYNYAFNFLWHLQESVEDYPQRTADMLSAIGVRHFILRDEVASYKVVAKMGRVPVSVHGSWLFAEIPVHNYYLTPAHLITVTDKAQIDYDEWFKTPWKAYSLGDLSYITESDDAPPMSNIKELTWRRKPNNMEIKYRADRSGTLVCNLAYQPLLKATLDGTPLPIHENLVNGLIWFASPEGTHRLCLFRARSLYGWLALLASSFTLSICIFFSLRKKKCVT